MTKDEVKNELQKRGVEVNAGACGCCQSPWIEVRLDGKKVLETEGEDLEMFKENS